MSVKSDFSLAIRGNWCGSGNESIIVNVYGPHKDVDTRLMRESLEKLMCCVDTAWVLCGDFNEVREEEDRMNCTFHHARANCFNDCISRNRLIKIPITGKKFTRISDDGLKFSKLDRFIVLDKLISLWKDLSVIPLDRRTSDHCPIILRDKVIDLGPKHFKVFDEWFNKKGVDKIIQEAWSNDVRGNRKDCRFRHKLKNVTFALKNWNKTMFGNLESEISELKRKVDEWESKDETGLLMMMSEKFG
ncbi:uncharacterized protein [Rutidosis leptorrhynchoides]|uniref:uncharacterized protein n=1 Tax=Rutidosis leptorrhynchoides TaxID=125765 RepID=UPI003A9A2E21